MLAPVDLAPLEPHPSPRVRAPCAPCAAASTGRTGRPGPEGDQPGRTVVARVGFGRLGTGHQIHPLGIGRQVGDDDEEVGGVGRGDGGGGALHPPVCPRNAPLASRACRGLPTLRGVNARTIRLDRDLDPVAIGARSGMVWARDGHRAGRRGRGASPSGDPTGGRRRRPVPAAGPGGPRRARRAGLGTRCVRRVPVRSDAAR